MTTPTDLLPPHGGYRTLKGFQVAQLVFDEDFLRQRGGHLWPREHPALAELRQRRPTTLAAFRAWANERPPGPSPPRRERVANGALLLIGVACYCLDRQLAALGREFARDGGFSERLYRVRSAERTRAGRQPD